MTDFGEFILNCISPVQTTASQAVGYIRLRALVLEDSRQAKKEINNVATIAVSPQETHHLRCLLLFFFFFFF